MLQPVVPYALTGLALGSLMKRPGAGALIGSLVGVAQTTSTGSMGRLGYGLGPGSPEGISKGKYRAVSSRKIGSGAPQIALTLKNAKLAVGYAVKQAYPSENRGWSPSDIGNWSKAPWRHYGTPKGVLFEGDQYLAKKGSKYSSVARQYLKKVKDATLSKPLSMREFAQKFKGDLFAPKPKKSARKSTVPVQGPREDTQQYISSSGPIDGQPGAGWWNTPKGKIGIAALAGTGALVLILMLTRR